MVPKKMLIRQLISTDSDEYLTLFLRGVREHPLVFRISPTDITNEPIPFISSRPGDFTLGAFDERHLLIGAVSFQREIREKLAHKGLIYRMFVCAEASGAGIGRKLLRAAIEQASKLPGLEQLYLTVIASNERAKHLYYSEGFRSFALEQNALKIEGDYYDEEQMTLHLYDYSTKA